MFLEHELTPFGTMLNTKHVNRNYNSLTYHPDVNQDLNQVLYERCSFRNGENQQCEGFVPRALPHTTCSLHVQLPGQAMRIDVQKDLEEAKESDRYARDVPSC